MRNDFNGDRRQIVGSNLSPLDSPFHCNHVLSANSVSLGMRLRIAFPIENNLRYT